MLKYLQNFKKFILFLILILFLYFIDEDEIYNNPNLHSEEQDELEIPDGKCLKIILID
jgi:hypothetical protein